MAKPKHHARAAAQFFTVLKNERALTRWAAENGHLLWAYSAKLQVEDGRKRSEVLHERAEWLRRFGPPFGYPCAVINLVTDVRYQEQEPFYLSTTEAHQLLRSINPSFSKKFVGCATFDEARTA